MEKQAVIKAGETPSEVSNRPCEMVKKGKAVCEGELSELEASEELLAYHMTQEYNNSSK